MKEKNVFKRIFSKILCVFLRFKMYIIHNDELVIISLFTLFLSLVRFLSIPVNSIRVRVKLSSILSLVRCLLSEHIRGRQFRIDYKLRTSKVIFTPKSFISHSNMVINLRDKKYTEERLKNCLQSWDSVTLH